MTKDKQKESVRLYYQKHQGDILQQKKEYYQQNKEQINKQRKEHYQKNKEQQKEYWKLYRQRNKEQIRQQKREYHLKYKYDITLENYKKMFEEQGGVCAICGKTQTEFKRAFDIDHDHETGKVRGLLCNSCNTALGTTKAENLNEQQKLYLKGEKNGIRC